MKKIALLFCIFLCSFSLSAEIIKVMSFNVQGYSNHNHRASVNNVWLTQICSIIQKSQADIVLLQEFAVEDERDINPFLEKLGNNWQYFCSNKYIEKGRVFSRDQNNIIFFNNRIIIPTSNKDDGIVNFSAQNLKYKFSKNNTQIVEFCISGRESEKFLVINVHLPTKKTNETIQAKDLELLDCLYKDLTNRKYKFIIGGDFNKTKKTLPYDGRFQNAMIDSENKYFQGLPTWFPQKDLDSTTLNPLVDLDHFIIYDIKIHKEIRHPFRDSSDYRGPYGNLPIGKKTYTRSKEFIKDISDHFPIIIELEV